MLEDLKGIGPKTISNLNDINIYTVNDLLTNYPFKYNVYKPEVLNIQDSNETVVLTGEVYSSPKVFYIKGNLNRLSFKFNTSNKLINVTIFNRAFLKQHLNINSTITVIGKYNLKTNTLTANDIKLIPILKLTIEPVYHLSQKIKKSAYKKILSTILSSDFKCDSYIPSYIEQKYKFITKRDAILNIHNPKNLDMLKASRLYLIYEELFCFMIKIIYLKNKNNDSVNRIVKTYDSEKLNNIISKLPFKLTDQQVNALEDIKNDFNLPTRMNRLIMGDVGSGKTIVAFLALYINYLAGFQGVLMAPTEVLAKQHYQNMLSLFGNLMRVDIITGSVKKVDKIKIFNKIKNGDIDILIGTHALLNEDIAYKNLGLVITDEQHRFGVNQRRILQEKGNDVDVLYLSATPIPRTLALTIYGDMSISQIKSKPADRKEIYTKLVKNKDIKTVLEAMVNEIKLGHQIYVVAPLIDDEESSLDSVITLENKLNVAFNKKIPMGLLHGQMKNSQKDEIMNNFTNGKIKILISTTVIEVGVDVANATMMVVFNAERFGLATLHQLRGRVGRNNLQSYCYLISDSDTERLKVLEESNDGFYISEQDFKLRGSGDVFGVKQSGEQTFKIANLNRDYKILVKCKEDAEVFLKNNNLDDYPNIKSIFENLNIVD
ncbi:MAG: ATP-dependent DNA helicase RecG [Tenericutes bacterium]|nr:ATP-dependent DNA helicase RecG [Mycoplasmatota bacterium]